MGPALIYRAYIRWQRTSTVYNFHPDMVTALGQTAHDRVPARTLDAVPHVNPMICFPHPQPCVNASGDPAHLIAAYVTGMDLAARTLCDTDDDRRTGLRLIMVTCDPARPDSLEHAAAQLDTHATWFDFDEEVAKASQRQAQLSPDGYTVAQHATAFASKLQPALRALMYVTSKGMDNALAPVKAGRKQARTAGGTSPQLHDIGFREGPELVTAHRRYDSETRGAGTGTSPRPHPRASHYAVRWTGPGGQVPERRFVRATYVNRPKPGQAPPPTVIAVRDAPGR